MKLKVEVRVNEQSVAVVAVGEIAIFSCDAAQLELHSWARPPLAANTPPKPNCASSVCGLSESSRLASRWFCADTSTSV